jgi:hypothetical protein
MMFLLSLDWLGVLLELRPLPWLGILQFDPPVGVTAVPTARMSCHPEEALSVLPLDMALAHRPLYIALKEVRYPAVKNGKSAELQSLLDKKSTKTEDLFQKSSRRV